MAIEFLCVTCQKLLRVGDDAAGKKARCPDCGTIQDVTSAPRPPADAPRPPPEIPIPSVPSPRISPASAGSSPFTSPTSATASNPFGETPFRASGPTTPSMNPYLPPPTGYGNPIPGIGTPAERRIAQGKVLAPAVSLMVLHSITVCIYVAVLASSIFDLAKMPNAPDVVIGIVVNATIVIMSGFVVFGAFQMRRMRHYGIAMAAAIISIVPCGPCCFLSIGLGVWGLVVLFDPMVKRSFDS